MDSVSNRGQPFSEGFNESIRLRLKKQKCIQLHTSFDISSSRLRISTFEFNYKTSTIQATAKLAEEGFNAESNNRSSTVLTWCV